MRGTISLSGMAAGSVTTLAVAGLAAYLGASVFSAMGACAGFLVAQNVINTARNALE